MLLETAIESFDIMSLVLEHGGEQAKADEFLLVCPECGKRKLSVNTSKKTWHCWVCQTYAPPDHRGWRMPLRGAGGLVDLVKTLKGVGTQAAVEWLQKEAEAKPFVLGPPKPPRLRQARPEGFELPPAVAIPAPPGSVPITGTLPYMLERGITMQDVQQFGLWWCNEGRYANRLVFPVYERGVLVYYQCRAMWAPQPGEVYLKALNPPSGSAAVRSHEVLMNLDVARGYPRVAVVEGPIDCIHAGPSAVATFGKAISAMQVAKLRLAGVKAIDFMWDGPGPTEPHGALPEMLRSAPLLATYFDVRIVQLPLGDPGTYPRDQLDAWREGARPWQDVQRDTQRR